MDAWYDTIYSIAVCGVWYFLLQWVQKNHAKQIERYRKIIKEQETDVAELIKLAKDQRNSIEERDKIIKHLEDYNKAQWIEAQHLYHRN